MNYRRININLPIKKIEKEKKEEELNIYKTPLHNIAWWAHKISIRKEKEEKIKENLLKTTRFLKISKEQLNLEKEIRFRKTIQKKVPWLIKDSDTIYDDYIVIVDSSRSNPYMLIEK